MIQKNAYSTCHRNPIHTSTNPTHRTKTGASSHRAWAEINLSHLQHNVSEIQQVLPKPCRIMAVVKANAYGHGSIEIARYLNRIGISWFAVAEINEGIQLREHGVFGDILVLGYTSPERARDLARYKLTQTLISTEYGESLNAYGVSLKVHVKVDTGMNRLGEPSDHFESILQCYQFDHLQVTGTYSHLAESDGLSPEQVEFTRLQMGKFDQVLDGLRTAGIDPGLVHLQSSYGILNYPGMSYDLVRPGIALYGLLSHEGDRVLAQADLHPVLTLKAAVTQVKDVPAHCPVGYGRAFISPYDMKIAIVSMGYADGLPRNLSSHGGYVLIRGQRASIIGSICMDQMIVDVTTIAGVKQGDTATIIGQDEEQLITAGQIASRSGTVTNEILSRLGDRVERVFCT